MPAPGAFDALPIWAEVLLTLLIVLLSVEAGFRLGRRRHRMKQHEAEGPVGAMVGAALGLLALLLAFTFGLAAARFDARRMVLLEESNAIGTAWLRAGLIPEPHGARARELLREYVDIRLEAARSSDATHAMRRSDELHRLLWAEVTAVGSNGGTITAGLFIQSINEVIDLHAKRVMLAMRNRIPATIWSVLYGVGLLALGAMGYLGGLSGAGRSPGFLIVCIAFVAVLWLILDLDRPQEGMMRVSQQAMIDLRESMNEPAP